MPIPNSPGGPQSSRRKSAGGGGCGDGASLCQPCRPSDGVGSGRRVYPSRPVVRPDSSTSSIRRSCRNTLCSESPATQTPMGTSGHGLEPGRSCLARCTTPQRLQAQQGLQLQAAARGGNQPAQRDYRERASRAAGAAFRLVGCPCGEEEAVAFLGDARCDR